MDNLIELVARWPKKTDDKRSTPTGLVQLLRWLIPGLMALFGASYHSIEHIVLRHELQFDAALVRDAIVLGTVGPLLVWFSLTWVARAFAARDAVEGALARRNRELSALNAVARTIAASLGLQSVLNDALEQVLKVTEVDAGEIFLLDDDQSAVEMAAHCGASVEALHEIERFKLGEGFPGRVAQSGRPLMTTDLAHERTFLRRQVVEAGFGSYACVPLWAEGQVVGVLSVLAKGQRPFSSDDINLLTSIGLQLGLAIEKSLELADTLRRVSRAIGASLKLDDVLREILHQLGRVLIVDAGLILLAEGERLTVAASRGRTKLGLYRLVGYTFDAHESPYLEQVLREKVPLTFCDPERTDVFSDGIGRIEDVQWCLVVPLMHGGEAIGLLTLEQIGHCYEQEEEAQIAFAFANHAAMAIANARLFEHSQKVAMLEERDRLAHNMHDGLVQTLTFLNMKLETVQVRLHADQVEQAQGDLGRMKKVVGQAYEDLRQLIVGLREARRPEASLETLLRERVASVEPRGDVAVELTVAPGWADGLSSHATTQVANIVQEALANVYKHAQARHAWVRLSQDGNKAQVVIEDDGRGLILDRKQTYEDNGKHFGMAFMRERAESVGGHLTIAQRPGEGTRVVVEVPLDTPGLLPYDCSW
jgi:nitrate/nitrite-specific signal transduction histidine kinase